MLKTLLAAAIAAAFAFPAFAAGDKASSTGSDKSAATGASSSKSESSEFNKMDKNHDGFVSKEEAKGSEHEKDFDKMDKNHDGKLSRAEHEAGEKSASSGATSSKMDKNEKHDGKTSK